MSEVAGDWHELIIPQHTMWPSIAHVSKQLDPQADIPLPQSGLHPIARKILPVLISHPE